MPNTLHVDYELMTHDETVKVVEAAMEIARKEIANKLRLSLFFDTDLQSAAIKKYSLTEFAKGDK